MNLYYLLWSFIQCVWKLPSNSENLKSILFAYFKWNIMYIITLSDSTLNLLSNYYRISYRYLSPISPRARGLFDLIIACRLILRVIIDFTWRIPKTTVSCSSSGGGCRETCLKKCFLEGGQKIWGMQNSTKKVAYGPLQCL